MPVHATTQWVYDNTPAQDWRLITVPAGASEYLVDIDGATEGVVPNSQVYEWAGPKEVEIRKQGFAANTKVFVGVACAAALGWAPAVTARANGTVTVLLVPVRPGGGSTAGVVPDPELTLWVYYQT